MGGSLASLLRSSERASASILLVFSVGGGVFGAFCPVPLPRYPNERPSTYFGDPSSFVFSLDPELHVHVATGRDEHYFRCDGERGLGIGGDMELPAISIATDLASGRCLPSHTFGDTASLAPAHFAIERVQLWDVTPKDPWAADAEAAAVSEDIRKASVLVGRQADAMMLPFRTSMLLRVH